MITFGFTTLVKASLLVQIIVLSYAVAIGMIRFHSIFSKRSNIVKELVLPFSVLLCIYVCFQPLLSSFNKNVY